jgi:hypothetical protein
MFIYLSSGRSDIFVEDCKNQSFSSVRSDMINGFPPSRESWFYLLKLGKKENIQKMFIYLSSGRSDIFVEDGKNQSFSSVRSDMINGFPPSRECELL